jgi:predicted O-methyltransferase YrrM
MDALFAQSALAIASSEVCYASLMDDSVLREELPSMNDILATLLAKDESRPREEPKIAANIGAQLHHMALTSLPLSVKRRYRDIIGKLRPNRICEVGAGIGHLSAWLFDLWQQDNWHPEKYQMVDGGSKFGIILTRLVQRFEAGEWADVRADQFEQLVAETLAQLAASQTHGPDVLATELHLAAPFDCIIVDVVWEGQASAIESALQVLSTGGMLLTLEPILPTGEIEEGDTKTERRVAEFQKWIDLIKELSQVHHLALQPLYGGAILALIKR